MFELPVLAVGVVAVRRSPRQGADYRGVVDRETAKLPGALARPLALSARMILAHNGSCQACVKDSETGE